MQELLTEVIIVRGCPELAELRELRAIGWKDEKLDDAFTRQRHISDTADENLNIIWYKRSNKVMKEIDMHAHCVCPMGALKFLDLGCCPGGFSSYVLYRNWRATGVGISLPVEEGGHKFGLDERLRNRFDLHYADVTSYQLGSSLIDHPRLSPIPLQIRLNSFDLVLLDAHQLRTQVSEYAAFWDIDRLLISQIILALRTVRTGGNLIVKLTHPERTMTAKILYLLDVLSGNLVTFKPRTMHMTRGSFYAIALGVGNGVQGSQMLQMTRGLQDVWVGITFGGEEGKGRFLQSQDLDFIVSDEEVKGPYLSRLISLGRDAWEVQALSLRGWFRSKGVL